MNKIAAKPKHSRLGRASQPYYWAMVLPGLLLVLLFHYGPMFGIVMAFQDFVPAKGLFDSKWNQEMQVQVDIHGHLLIWKYRVH